MEFVRKVWIYNRSLESQIFVSLHKSLVLQIRDISSVHEI